MMFTIYDPNSSSESLLSRRQSFGDTACTSCLCSYDEGHLCKKTQAAHAFAPFPCLPFLSQHLNLNLPLFPSCRTPACPQRHKLSSASQVQRNTFCVIYLHKRQCCSPTNVCIMLSPRHSRSPQ